MSQPFPRTTSWASILVAAAIGYGGWAGAGLVLSDGYYDAPVERIAFGALGLVVAGVLLRRQAPSRQFEIAGAAYAYAGYTHFISLFIRSDGSEVYALGLLIVFSGASLLFVEMRSYLSFATYALGLSVVAAQATRLPHDRFVMLALGFVTIGSVTTVLLFFRIRLLEDYHQQRVQLAALETQALAEALETVEVRATNYRQQAESDALTGLANRRSFLEHLDLTFARAQHSGESFGVLFADLDGFKVINDTYGHDVGDAVLRRFADHFRLALRKSDVPARLAGDEFVAILPDLRGLEDVRPICERILGIGREAIRVNESIHCSLGVSIGVALHAIPCVDGEPAGSPQDLLLRADTAMYEAKRTASNSWVGYSSSLESERFRRILGAGQVS